MIKNANRATLEDLTPATMVPGISLLTDEWRAHHRISELGRSHTTFDHSAGEWARDDDGDGIRELHTNTMEGTWTGLRNFFRPFRDVIKLHLSSYVYIFE